MSKKEKSILLLAVGPTKIDPANRWRRRHSWYIVPPITDSSASITETFDNVQPLLTRDLPQSSWDEYLSGVSCVLLDSTLYAVGGQRSSWDQSSKSICFLNTLSPTQRWGSVSLRSPSAYSPIGVFGHTLYILPGNLSASGHCDEDSSIMKVKQMAYTFDTKNKRVMDSLGGLPLGTIRGCAALDGKGLLVAVDADDDQSNFYIHKPGQKEFEACSGYKKLPKFSCCTVFTVLKDRLFILDATEEEVLLFAFDLSDGRQVMKQHICQYRLNELLDDKTRNMSRIVAVADDTLCIMWPRAPCFHRETSRMHGIIRCLKVTLSENPALAVKDAKYRKFDENILGIIDCLAYDPPVKEEGFIKDEESRNLCSDEGKDATSENPSSKEMKHLNYPKGISEIIHFLTSHPVVKEEGVIRDDPCPDDKKGMSYPCKQCNQAPILSQSKDIDLVATKKRSSFLVDFNYGTLCNGCQDRVRDSFGLKSDAMVDDE